MTEDFTYFFLKSKLSTVFRLFLKQNNCATQNKERPMVWKWENRNLLCSGTYLQLMLAIPYCCAVSVFVCQSHGHPTCFHKLWEHICKGNPAGTECDALERYLSELCTPYVCLWFCYLIWIVLQLTMFSIYAIYIN